MGLSLHLPGYRSEAIVVLLVACASLAIISPAGPQDETRLGLANAIAAHGTVRIDRFHSETIDKARHAGHWYSDKAPGVSLIQIPAALLVRAVGRESLLEHPASLQSNRRALWGLRLWPSGLAFLALVVLSGRFAEGLVAGTGAATAVTVGIGTMLGSLAPTSFAHVPAALLIAVGLALAVRAPGGRWRIAAGAALGAAALIDYLAAIPAVAVVVVVAVRSGWRAGGLVAAGGLPFLLILMAYNTVAFGSPWELSYSYVSSEFSAEQSRGLFGIHIPTLAGIRTVLFDGNGILLVSPVLAAAALGLLDFARSHRFHALLAGATALWFLGVSAGYFLPYGGVSPGPRFAAPAIPLLLIGLPFAFARAPWITAGLAGVSVFQAMRDELSWMFTSGLEFSEWPDTIWNRLGTTPAEGGLLTIGCAIAAALVAARSLAGVSRSGS